MSGISVVTASLPERAELLVEAIRSVDAQTLPAQQHHIYLDAERGGPARARNDCLARVTTPWVGFLDDDDVLYPEHYETLMRHADGADLVFSHHDGGPDTPRYESWDTSAYMTMLNGRNVIPVTVLAKTQAIVEAGCFDPADRYEDFELWKRMLARGATFRCVPEVTWEYRCPPDGRTWNP